MACGRSSEERTVAAVDGVPASGEHRSNAVEGVPTSGEHRSNARGARGEKWTGPSGEPLCSPAAAREGVQCIGFKD